MDEVTDEMRTEEEAKIQEEKAAAAAVSRHTDYIVTGDPFMTRLLAEYIHVFIF